RQRIETILDRPADAALTARGLVDLQRLFDRGKKTCGVDRLRQKVHRTHLHGMHAGLDIAVAREKYDGTTAFRPGQRTLHIEPAHSRHADVEQQTSRRLAVLIFEKSFRRIERPHFVARGPQNARQRGTNFAGVIYYEYGSRPIAHG